MPKYDPGTGFPVEIKPVPVTMQGSDQWIDANLMLSHVRSALEHTVASVKSFGQGSIQLRKWRNIDTQNRPYEVWAGEWLTHFGQTPTTILNDLVAQGLPPTDEPGYHQRQLKVRYWTERYQGLTKPGGLYLAIVVRRRRRASGTSARVLQPQRLEIMISDFITHIQGISP